MSIMGAVGLCSICGGVVYAHVGAWYGTVPPAPGKCSKCGAVEASKLPVIDMIPSSNDNSLGNYTVNGNVLDCNNHTTGDFISDKYVTVTNTDNFLVKNADVTDNFLMKTPVVNDNFLIKSNGNTTNTTTLKPDDTVFFCSN